MSVAKKLLTKKNLALLCKTTARVALARERKRYESLGVISSRFAAEVSTLRRTFCAAPTFSILIP